MSEEDRLDQASGNSNRVRFTEQWEEYDKNQIVEITDDNRDRIATAYRINVVKDYDSGTLARNFESSISLISNGDRNIIEVLRNQGKSAATEMAANIIEERHTFKSIVDDTKNDKEIWVFNNGIYVQEGLNTIASRCRELFGIKYSDTLKNEVTSKIYLDTQVDKNEFFNQSQEYPHLIAVKNGILNILTGKFSDFDPGYIFFSKVNAKYDPKASCPKINNFLDQILGTDEQGTKNKQLVKEFIGYTLYRGYPYEKAFMLCGKHGRNGKTELINLIENFLGGPANVSHVTFKSLAEDQFALSELHGKLLNSSGETINKAIDDTETFKKVTGSDIIDAARKYLSPIRFRNHAKMLFAANKLPTIFSESDSFWYRWVVIWFRYQFLPEQDLDPNKPYQFAYDPHIKEKIYTQQELNGLLLLALEGVQKLFKNDQFSSDNTMQQIREEWKRQSNSIYAFLSDYVESDPTSYITKQEFLQEYKKFCKEFDMQMVSDKILTISLKEEHAVMPDRKYLDGEQKQVWLGIKWIGTTNTPEKTVITAEKAFYMFLEETVMPDDNSIILKDELRDVYKMFIQKHDYDELSDSKMGRILKNVHEVTSTQRRLHGRPRVWKGIRWSPGMFFTYGFPLDEE